MDAFERWYWRNAPVLYWLPTVMYMLVIWASSASSAPEETILGDNPILVVMSALPLKDKLQHALAYFILGCLVSLAVNHTRYPRDLRRLRVNAALSLLASSVYGAVDEFHQFFVPMREMSVMDLVADVIGVSCGVYLVHVLTRETCMS